MCINIYTLYMCIYIYIYAQYVHVYVCIYIYISAKYVHVYVCIYIYIYIYMVPPQNLCFS